MRDGNLDRNLITACICGLWLLAVASPVDAQPVNEVDNTVSSLFESFEDVEGILKSFEPISQDAYKQMALEPLVMWGIFNPLGPTVSTLSLASLEGSEINLFLFTMLNPFHQEAWIAGALSAESSDNKLIHHYYQLFEKDAEGDAHLSPALPTFVLPLSDRLSHYAYTAFQYPAKQSQEDIAKLCKVYNEFLGKPWDRTQAQAQDALTTKRGPATPFDEQAFIEWGTLMMNREHLYPEMAGLKDAWEGAIGFQKQMGTLGVHKTLMRFNEANEHLAAIGFTVFRDR